MKNNIQIIFSLVIAILSTQSINAQDKKVVTTKFWVAGVCGMCETTIEKTMDTKGVVTADYDLASNMLTVTYNSKKISEESLHKLLNEAGYDTEKSTCSDEQYKKVHGCCQYRELEKH
jgi:mercuric ion binding protein